MRRRAAGLLAALAGLLAIGAPPAAADVVTVRGASGPGPERYDRVTVERFGPRSARRVLVLVPGLGGGAGDFALIGPELVRRVPGLQVWALDRRSQALEDTRGFDTGDPDRARDYYLAGGRLDGRRFAPVSGDTAPFTREWGLSLALADLRRVVRAARRGGRRVLLGGHSLGATTAATYAAWDFGGRPGHRDLSGLVLIDGGVLGTFGGARTPAALRRELAAIRAGSPFTDLLGLGAPWAAGVFAGLGGLDAAVRPTAPSSLTQSALLPAAFKPPFAPTTAAQLGFALDKASGPPPLALLRVNAGAPATAGDPRGWTDTGEVSTIDRVARLLARSPVNAAEWYFPRRLALDAQAASPLRRDAATRLLGLRPWHRRSVGVPLYAFQTDLTRGRVLRGARRLIAGSRIPRRESLLVDRSRTFSHLDPLTAVPARSPFLASLARFLRAGRD